MLGFIRIAAQLKERNLKGCDHRQTTSNPGFASTGRSAAVLWEEIFRFV